MPALSSESKLIGGYLLWLLAGTVIGALLSSLAGSPFQHYVRVFYPRDASMRLLADVAVGLQPIALVGPALGPAYYCRCHGLAKIYLFVCAAPTAIAAWFLSPYIQGEPVQPFTFIVPASVFVATVVALIIQVVRKDWIDHETPRP